MEKLVWSVALAIACLVCISCSSKKSECKYTAQVVIDQNGEVVGKLVEERANTYVVSVQDDVEICKDGHHIVVYSACDGQGVVYVNDPNSDYLPEAYKCKGMDGDQFIVVIDNELVTISAENAEWDCINRY